MLMFDIPCQPWRALASESTVLLHLCTAPGAVALSDWDVSCDQTCLASHSKVCLHREKHFFFSFGNICTFRGACTIFLFLLKGILITHPFSFGSIFPALGSGRAEMTLSVGLYSLWSWLVKEVTVLRGLSQSERTLEIPLGELFSTHTSAGRAERNFTKYLRF